VTFAITTRTLRAVGAFVSVASSTIPVAVRLAFVVFRIAIVPSLAAVPVMVALGRGVGRYLLFLRIEIELDAFLACADRTRRGCR
jgi:hypothetical protein